MTLGTMIDRIADELGARTDLNTQIEKAIRSAIKFHERERFYFNEAHSTFTTSIGQEYYDASHFSNPGEMVEIDSIRVTVDGSSYTLIPRDYGYIDSVASGSSITGEPSDYAKYGQQLRLYPIPSAARTVVVSHLTKFASLSATTSSNAWMVDGEELIRYRAKADLFLNVIRDPQESGNFVVAEQRVLDGLRSETTRRISSGRLRPTAF